MSIDLASPLNASAIRRLVRSLSLRFSDPRLEHEYQRDRRLLSIVPTRNIVYIGIFFMAAFIWQDNVISPERGYLAVYIRVYGALPLCLIGISATYRQWGKRYIDILQIIFISLYSICVVAIFTIFNGTKYGLNSSAGVSNIMLLLFAVFGISYLSFWRSICLASLIIVIYGVPSWVLWDSDLGDFLFGDFLTVVSGGVVGGYISLLKELKQRQLFVTSRQLTTEQERYQNLLSQVDQPSANMPEGAIFISYAREDIEAVRRLKSALDAAGLKAWFDFDRLGPGDTFDQKIRQDIRRCALFVPVLSHNTEARGEGFFRREWRYALDRDFDIDPGRPFIVPVTIDPAMSYSTLPDRFQEVNITDLPGGYPSEEFVSRLKQIMAGR